MTAVVAVGTFDGVHRGHQHLLGELARRARLRACPATIVTFDPPPRVVLHPGQIHQLLTSLDERVALLRRHGADHVEVLPFDLALASSSPEQFCRRLVDQLGMVELVGGPDLALGHRRAGTAPVLSAIGARLGFVVRLLDQVTLGGEAVRSGEIRRRLSVGAVADAARLLGRPPTLSGIVVRCEAGRTQVELPAWRLAPPPGIYAAELDGQTATVTITAAGHWFELRITSAPAPRVGEAVTVSLLTSELAAPA